MRTLTIHRSAAFTLTITLLSAAPVYADDVIYTSPALYSSPGVISTPGALYVYDTSPPGNMPTDITIGAATQNSPVAIANPYGLAEDPAGNIYFAEVSTTSTTLTAYLDVLSPTGVVSRLLNDTPLFTPIDIAQVGLPAQNIDFNLAYNPANGGQILFNTPQTIGAAGQPSTISAYNLTSKTTSVIYTLPANVNGSIAGLAVDPTVGNPTSGNIYFTELASVPYSATLNQLPCATVGPVCTYPANQVTSYGTVLNPSSGPINAFAIASSLAYDPFDPNNNRGEIIFNTPEIVTSPGSGAIGALSLASQTVTQELFTIPTGSPEGVTADPNGNIFTQSTTSGPFSASLVENGSIISGPLINTDDSLVFGSVTNSVLSPTSYPCAPSRFFATAAASPGCIYQGPIANPLMITTNGNGLVTSGSANIGPLGSTYFSLFPWATEGPFIADAMINGANANGSYYFDLINLSGMIIDGTDIDGPTFTGEIDFADLTPGDYEIGLVSADANDPTFTITFETPVASLGPASTVPEPSTVAIIIPILCCYILWYRWRGARKILLQLVLVKSHLAKTMYAS